MHSLTKCGGSVLCSHSATSDPPNLITWAKSRADECEYAMVTEALLNTGWNMWNIHAVPPYCWSLSASRGTVQCHSRIWLNSSKTISWQLREKHLRPLQLSSKSGAQREYHAYIETVYEKRHDSVYQVWRNLETRFLMLAGTAVECLTGPGNSGVKEIG